MTDHNPSVARRVAKVKEAIARGDMRMAAPKAAAPAPSIGTFEDAVRYAAEAVEHLGRPIPAACGAPGCFSRATVGLTHGPAAMMCGACARVVAGLDAFFTLATAREFPTRGIRTRHDVKDISPHLHAAILRNPIPPLPVDNDEDGTI